MKRTLRTVVLFTLVAVFCAANALAGPTIDRILQKKELVVGTTGTYPPLTFKAKNGNLYGLDIEVSRLIADSMGVKLRVVETPFDQLLTSLAKGNVDLVLSCLTITPQRNLQFAFIGPYFISGQSVLTTKEIAININGPADIDKAGFRIALPKGTTSEQIARKILTKSELVPVGTTGEATTLLLQKKVQAVMVDYPYAKLEAFRHQDQGLIATNPISFEPIGIALAGNDPLMLNFLDNLIGTLRNTGELDAMAKRWFSDSSWMKDLVEP